MQVRNGFGFEVRTCSSVVTGWLQGPSQGSPTRTSHICRSGWTQERSRLRKTPAAPAEKGGVKRSLNQNTDLAWKFIPAPVYWQKEGKILLLLRMVSLLPCQSLARGGSAWRTSLVMMLSLGQLCCVCPPQKPHLWFCLPFKGSWGLKLILTQVVKPC